MIEFLEHAYVAFVEMSNDVFSQLIVGGDGLDVLRYRRADGNGVVVAARDVIVVDRVVFVVPRK